MFALAAAITVGVILMTVPFVVGGSGLFSLVFGPKFGGASAVFLISCSANLIFGIFGPCSVFLNMTGHQKCVAQAFAFSVVANVFVAVVFVPSFGSCGAALANVAGALVWNLLSWRDKRRLTGIDTSINGFLACIKLDKSPAS